MVDTISFVLPKSEYEDFTWILQDEHNPASHPPLIASGSPLVKPPDIENSDEIPETLTINGFYYLREVEDKDANQSVKSRFPHVSQPESVEDITRWRKDWLPEMDKLVALLENFDPNSGMLLISISLVDIKLLSEDLCKLTNILFFVGN